MDACPTCEARTLVRHCELGGCTWLRCASCRSYGTVDGRRWVDKERAA